MWLGSDILVVGLNNLKGFSQPKWFYYCVGDASKKCVCDHFKLVPWFMEWLQYSLKGLLHSVGSMHAPTQQNGSQIMLPELGQADVHTRTAQGGSVVAWKYLSLRPEPRDSWTLVLLIRLYDFSKIIFFLDISCIVWCLWVITSEIVKVYKNLGFLVQLALV